MMIDSTAEDNIHIPTIKTYFPRIPGITVDRIDVPAGMRALRSIGHYSVETQAVIEYALMRWARGEEQQADRTATDSTFYGVDMTTWRHVLAAARAAGGTAAETAVPDDI